MEPNTQPQPVEAPVVIPPLPPVGEIISRTFSLFKRKWGALFPLLAIMFIASVLNTASGYIKGGAGSILVGIIFVAYLVITYLTSVALIMAYNDEEVKPVVDYYQRAIDIIIPYSWVVVAVILAVIGGMVFLIIPGLLLAFFLTYASYAFLLEGKTKIDALVTSFEYVKEAFWGILWRDIVFGLLAWLIMFGVGILAAIPTVLQSGGVNHLVNAIRAGDTSGLFLGQIIHQMGTVFIATPLGIAFVYTMYNALRARRSVFTTESSTAASLIKIAIYIGAAILIVGFIISMVYLSRFAMTR